ncbi:DUF4270 domain-containing protein [Paucihalobacter sp.]|uniref:DUF4270 domain-containing protein n=1 Tax=Paucihalobacter sp. TaxID=2850405 RepID=UPI002FE09EEF
MNKNLLHLIFGACLLAILFVSCETEFVSLDSDVLNNNNATNFGNNSERFNIKAYTKLLGPIQTSNLPIYSLGVYSDPFYGQTTASVVTQITSSTLNPNFGVNPVLDSVVLTIPYFSRSVGVGEDNRLEFELDSVFGSDPIKLSIYENNFFLRSFDPNLGLNEQQSYYSNGTTSESDFIDPSSLEGTLLHVVDELAPDNSLIVLENEEGEITGTLNPSIRVKFTNLEYWQNKIIDKQGEPELSNQSNFNNYFRGLYFKAEPINGIGNLMLLNLNQVDANITLYYKKDPITEGNDKEATTFTLTFSGNRVNFLTNEFVFPISDGDPINGDEQLFLKGAQGSLAVLNLFDGDEEGNSSILENLRNDFKNENDNTKKRLVNEAHLVVYVDQTATANLVEPRRLFLYDLTNNRPLLDYFQDNNNNTFPQASIINHLGPLQTTEGKGVKYRFRITEHIRNIIFNDSTNVKLGLSVSGNVNLETINQYNVLSSSNEFNKIPLSSNITPRSTILHGNQSPIEEKRLYLEIFYTEPEN